MSSLDPCSSNTNGARLVLGTVGPLKREDTAMLSRNAQSRRDSTGIYNSSPEYSYLQEGILGRRSGEFSPLPQSPVVVWRGKEGKKNNSTGAGQDGERQLRGAECKG